MYIILPTILKVALESYSCAQMNLGQFPAASINRGDYLHSH